MAHISLHSTATFGHDLAAAFHRLTDAVSERFAARRAFNATFDELNSLSDRDLSDLGIARCDISRIAQEAARG